MTILPTKNEAWGFTGETKSGGDFNADWDQASRWLQETYGMEPVDARNYLDSKHGRHLADALTFMTLEEIERKWARHMRSSVRAVIESRDSFED